MEIRQVSDQWIDIRHGDAKRTSGLHVSGLIRALAVRAGKLDADEVVTDPGPSGFGKVTELRMAMGLAWEDWLSRQIPGMEYHPGEFECDGIVFSPDGLDLDNRRLHEFKVTWKSANGGIDKQFMWLLQCQAYLWGLGLGDWTQAWLHVYYVCGDYSKPITPLYRVYQCDFEPIELRETWKTLQQYRELAVAEVHE